MYFFLVLKKLKTFFKITIKHILITHLIVIIGNTFRMCLIVILRNVSSIFNT